LKRYFTLKYITSLSSFKFKILNVLFLFVLYWIGIYKIERIASESLTKKSNWIRIWLILFLLSSIVSFVLVHYYLVCFLLSYEFDIKILTLFVAIYYGSWIPMSIIAASSTVKFESFGKDYHPLTKDYANRFFLFLRGISNEETLLLMKDYCKTQN